MTARSAAARADHDRATRAAHTAQGRAHAPAAPRRVSGPTHPAHAAARPARARIDSRALAMPEAALAPGTVPRPRVPSRPPLRLAAGGAAVALRVAEAAMEVSGSRTMDRLVRSRAWVVIVAFGLIGIVAMQVSMLKLNNGIGRAVETAATLERGNATLRADVSRLSSGDRIQAIAGQHGFIMPEPADVTYLTASSLGSDGLRAARRMRAPNAEIAGPAGSAVLPSTVDATLTPGPADANVPAGTGTAAATTAPAAAGATSTATGTAAATSTTAATGTTTAAGGAPTAPATAAPAPPAPAAPTQATAPATTSGGVTTP